MNYLIRKKYIWRVLAVSLVLCFIPFCKAFAMELHASYDDDLSNYEGNPGYQIEDGLVIEVNTHTVIECRSDVQSVRIPQGIGIIGCNAFEGCTLLRSIIIPEGVKIIEAGAFMGCERLSSISLPTTLETIEHYAFYGCRFDTLVIPRNTRLVPELNASEWYGVLTGCRVKTLVFCGTDGLFLPTTFGDIIFPADDSGRIVFMGEPPTHIVPSELQWNICGGEVGSGAFTICFPERYREQWMSSGETTWHEMPIRVLTHAEEEMLVTQNSMLFQDIDRTDLAVDPGWSFDLDDNVTIYTKSGWEKYCRIYWGMRIDTLEFEDGIETIPPFFNQESEENLYPGSPSITAQNLLLSSTVKEIDLTNMVLKRVTVASGNPYYYVRDGALIETATGKIIWQTASDILNESAGTSKEPLQKRTTQPLSTAKPTAMPKPEQEQGTGNDGTLLILYSCIAIVAAAFIVLAVRRRK